MTDKYQVSEYHFSFDCRELFLRAAKLGPCNISRENQERFFIMTDKNKVSRRALLGRLRRKLAHQGVKLEHDHHSRGAAHPWMLVENGNIIERNVSLKDLAAKWNALKDHEEHEE